MKQRKIPMRKCLVSNEQFPKNELTRVVVNKYGEVFVDQSGKLNGRGAYLHLTKENVAKARQRRSLENALRVKDLEAIYEELENLANE
ncbi:MAG: YlxR family protein [Erysipelotrichales bacterium]